MLSPWLKFARGVVETVVRGSSSDRIPPPAAPAPAHSGVFVTLRRFGRLRGCIGTVGSDDPFAEAVRSAAAAAASRDVRFPPITPGELPDLRIELSVLGAPQRIGSLAEIRLGLHGILVRQGERRGLFLPSVAIDHGLNCEQFLSRCCAEKAGIDADAWRTGAAEVSIFTTTTIREPG